MSFPKCVMICNQMIKLDLTSTGGNSIFLNIYFDDVDAIYEKAIDEDASVVMPLSDVFWSDIYDQIKDPFGHIWEIATHKK
jgi:PhnB protein